MINLRLISPPAAEPVTLALAKQHCQVSITDDDALMTMYISAARQYCERYLDRSIFNQTWQLTLDQFPTYAMGGTYLRRGNSNNSPLWTMYFEGVTIRLPKPSLVSVTSITYLDQYNQAQTLSPSTYYVDLSSEPARITPAAGTAWPYLNLYVPGSIAITYVAGSFGDGVEMNTCPQTIAMAILLLVGHWYANRESTTQANLKSIPFGVNELLDQYKFQVFSLD